MKSIDQASEAFDVYKKNVEEYTAIDLTESDTRSKLIDTLFVGVLGWEESDIVREEKVDSGYFDYYISIAGVNFIIEAKKSLKEFNIPKSHKRAKIKAIYTSNQEYFKQIQSYAIDKSCQFGVLTNGRQMIVAKLFNTDGKNWKENNCLIFGSLDDISNRFVEFYDNLSKFAVTNYGGFKFDLPIANSTYTKLRSSLIDADKELIRNSMSATLAPIIEKVFGEIYNDGNEDDEEFIKRCFVENQETKKNRDEIYRLFADKPPELANISKVVHTKNLESQILSEFSGDNIAIKTPTPPKPIIIIGTKGAGKTTFIHHLLKNDSADINIDHHLIIYIDLRKYFDINDDFDPKETAREILNDIYEKYPELNLHSLGVLKQMYFKEIRYNDESVWQFSKANDPSDYNKKLSDFFLEKGADSLKHLEFLNKYLIRERRKRLIIILDNADQFSAVIQRKVFLFSQSLSRTCLCGIILSLREGYYYKWRNSPPFDAYESNVYHITAPKYSEVLQRRIDYTLDKLELDKGKSVGVSSMGYVMTIPNSTVIEFLSGLKTSLFSDVNESLINFLSYTTYPNIREGLSIFKHFLISGHTNVEEYILRESVKITSKSLTVPIHEFIKSIGLNSKYYYDSEISTIHNLFIPPSDTDDHFFNLYILKDLLMVLEDKGNTGKYTSYSALFEKFVSFGYRPTAVKDAFRNLLKNNMVDSDESTTDVEWDSVPKELRISITSKGFYYFKELITRFHYIDLVLQDTPIYDEEMYKVIKTSFPKYGTHGKRSLQGRLNTVKNFMKYLDSRHNGQSKNLILVYGNMIDHIETGLNLDLAGIEQRTGRL